MIKQFKALLKDVKKILRVIYDEVKELEEKYGEDRRTKVVASEAGKFEVTDLIPNEATIVMMTNSGYIKRLAPDTFKTQSRGGKGVMGLTTKEADYVEMMFTTMTHADLLFFTSRGRVFKLKAYEVPQSSRTAKGQAIVNFLQLAPSEKVSAILSTDNLMKSKYLVMATQNGLIKKVEIEQFLNIRSNGLIAIKLKGEDALKWVKPSDGKDEIMVITSAGQSIRFKEKDVRGMGRTAAGVKAIKLKAEDEVVSMDVIDSELKKGFVLVVKG